MDNRPVLDVKNLKTSFGTERGRITAVDGISFSLGRGEILGVVGESGCGKSVTAQSILRLFDEHYTTHEGEVWFEGQNLLSLTQSEMHHVRGNHILMIFQYPLSSLNPVFTIGNQIAEAILTHKKVSKREAREKVLDLLRMTGIPAPEKRIDEYPHELSGGMRQRVMIAMALACESKVLIADEPTMALDVTIQAQIINLLKELQNELGLTFLFIAHDISVVRYISDRVGVMYLGQMVEQAETNDIFRDPKHPYTQALLSSVPVPSVAPRKDRIVLEGELPSPLNPPSGCVFHTRCPFAKPECKTKVPVVKEVTPGHQVACHLY